MWHCFIVWEGGKKQRRKKNCFQSTTSAFFSHLWPKGYSPNPLPPPHLPYLHHQTLQAEHCIWPLQKQFGKREDPVGVKMTVWLEAWSGETVTPTVCVCESVLRLKPNHRIDLRLEVQVKWLWGFRQPSLSFIYTAVRASSLTSTSQPIQSEFTLADIQAREMSR